MHFAYFMPSMSFAIVAVYALAEDVFAGSMGSTCQRSFSFCIGTFLSRLKSLWLRDVGLPLDETKAFILYAFGRFDAFSGNMEFFLLYFSYEFVELCG